MHYDHKQSELINGNTWQNTFFDPQWEFGHGLSYTSFKYSDLKLSKKNMSSDNKDSIVISFIIENTGEKAGKEATLLYLKDHYASITPQLKKLIRFDKVSLQPGQKETIKFVIKNKDLEFYGLENKWASEDGAFSIIIEDLQQSFNLKTL